MRYTIEALLASGVLVGVMFLGGTAAHAGDYGSDWNHDWHGGDNSSRWEHPGDWKDDNGGDWREDDGREWDWNKDGADMYEDDACDEEVVHDGRYNRADHTSYALQHEDNDNNDDSQDENSSSSRYDGGHGSNDY